MKKYQRDTKLIQVKKHEIPILVGGNIWVVAVAKVDRGDGRV